MNIKRIYPKILLFLLIVFLIIVGAFSYIGRKILVSYLEPRTFEVVEESDIAAQVRVEAIPKPGTLLCIGVGLLVTGVLLRMKYR